MTLVTTGLPQTRKQVEMAKRRTARQTAQTLSQAVLKAEKELLRPNENEARSIEVMPGAVETRPELFQPRMLTHGGRVVDARFVKKLVKRVGNIGGELEPVVVVKLNGRWVCVDGHHRLEAYAQRKWAGPIKAIWFDGTVREAVAESLRANEVDKLEMSLQDNYEQAWQRTVLRWGSKAEVVKATNVSATLVAHMRRVVEAYYRMDETGARMRRSLVLLEDSTWSAARRAHSGISSEGRDLQERAETLAKQLTKRMTNMLSKDPEVTALALKLYDRDLPQPLDDALQQYITKAGDDDGGDAAELPTVPGAAIREMSDAALLERLDRNQDMTAYLARKRWDIEREQDRRASLGTPLEVPGTELTEGAPEA